MRYFLRYFLKFFLVYFLFCVYSHSLLAVNNNQTKNKSKQIRQKNTISKDYQKLYQKCNGDVECIKFQINKYKYNNLKVEDIISHIENNKKINKKKEVVIQDNTGKYQLKNNNNNTNNVANKKTNKNSKTIKKTNIKLLDDKRIAKLIEKQQKLSIAPMNINVRVLNKGVPNVCLPQKNEPAKISKQKDRELEYAKKHLKSHIKKSLIKNEVSKELVEYIDNHLEYIHHTSKKNKEIVNRKVADFMEKYDIPSRIKSGMIYQKMYQEVLSDVESLFYVDRNIILTIWAMETNYGLFIGNHDTFNALYSACMNAYNLSRLRYFEDNLITFAILVDKGYFKKDAISSFDGGLGGCQFMPDSVYRFAVAFDGGKVDIIGNNKDVLASIGNYLHSMGWRYGEGVLTEVDVPDDFNICLYGLNTIKTVEEWEKLGVKLNKNRIGEDYFYNKKQKASLITTDPNNVLEEKKKKRTFLVYDNYKVLLSYNQYLEYGLTAGIIFDGLEKNSIDK